MNISIIIIDIEIEVQKKQQNLIDKEVMDLVYYLAFLPTLPPPFHNITVTFGDKNCVRILPSDPLDVLFAKGREGGGLGRQKKHCVHN